MGTLNFLSFTAYDPEGNELGEYDATAAILEPNAICRPTEVGVHYIAVSEFLEILRHLQPCRMSGRRFLTGKFPICLASRSTAASCDGRGQFLWYHRLSR